MPRKYPRGRGPAPTDLFAPVKNVRFVAGRDPGDQGMWVGDAELPAFLQAPAPAPAIESVEQAKRRRELGA